MAADVTLTGPSGREYKLYGPKGDHQVRHWRMGHFYEGDEGGLLEWAWDNPEYFERVVDIGASLGNHSVFFAGELGAEVFAIEPHTTDIVVRNVEANGLGSRVKIKRSLIGSWASYKMSPGPAHNVGMTSFSITEPGEDTITGEHLDELIGSFRPTAIKIDVEGMSQTATALSLSVILKHKPVVIVEEANRWRLQDLDIMLRDHTRLPQTFNSTPTHVWIPS